METFLYIIALLGIAALNAYWAKIKGYGALPWFLGGSVFGLVVMAFLPNIKDVIDDKKIAATNRGNTIGYCMAVASFVWGFAQAL